MSLPTRKTFFKDLDLVRSIRHLIGTGIAFIETAVKSMTGDNPDASFAITMYDTGAKKIRSALAQMDEFIRSRSAHQKLEFDGIHETVFKEDHPEMVRWTKIFEERMRALKIFENFESASPPSLSRSIVIGTLWHRFSSFMPWFLCQAASMVSSNLKRHYVIQTAFEELGMRDSDQIHCDMFLDATKTSILTCNVDSLPHRTLLAHRSFSPLSYLKNTLLSYHTDEEIMGILLGLEIPARENIETVFQSLAVTEEMTRELSEHLFFRLHRQIEIGHVQLTVSNFLRFCKTDEQKNLFFKGFDDGLNFWAQFWFTASAWIEEEKEVMSKSVEGVSNAKT